MAIGTISTPATWLNGTVAPASWFQNAQDNINGWIAGTGPTLKALQIDGTGGAPSTTPAGNMLASGGVGASSGVFDGAGGTAGTSVSGAVTVVSTAATGTSAPTPSFHKGTLYKDTVPLAWGVISSAALVCGVNVASVAHPGTGVYNITLTVGASATANLCPIVTTAGENITAAAQTTAANAFTVITAHGEVAPSGGRINMDFFFIVFGG